ncbi:MAG TPA: metallophosphoesterase [Spirochaetia bacterium]|jgi:predicted phosphodiesterase|nr:metallophosphoesterase [Spirochaetia bacterium]
MAKRSASIDGMDRAVIARGEKQKSGILPVMGDSLSGVELVERAISAVESYPGRVRDTKGRPGGLIELTMGKRPIIIGDLHANLDNFWFIVRHEDNLKAVESGEAVFISVGDIIHNDQTGHMREMEGSIAMLDAVLRFLVAHPGGFYYIRGNHDTFDERLRKSGIAQGAEFRKALLAVTSEEYVRAVERFFDALPMFVIGEGFIITHAGPIRGGCTRQELIDIKDYPDKYQQLMWNRVNEFHGTPSPREYGEADIQATRSLLGLSPDTHFIVGHNPLWNDGGTTGVWMDVIGMKNHHIIYSGTGSRSPYFTFENGSLITKFAIPKAAEVYYYG